MAKEIIKTDKAPAPIGPYNQAVKAGGLLFLSGQIAIDPASGEIIEGDIGEETQRVMKNIEAVLKRAGMDFDHVVKCSIFLKNMNDFPVVNEVYGRYFSEGSEPARETVEVACLPKDVNVEISVIAAE